MLLEMASYCSHQVEEGAIVRKFQLRSHMMYSALLHESEDQKLALMKASSKLSILERRYGI